MDASPLRGHSLNMKLWEKPFTLNSPQRKIICDSTGPRTFPPRTFWGTAWDFHMGVTSHPSCGNWELPEFSKHSVYVTCLKDGDSTCMDLILPTQWIIPHPHTVAKQKGKILQQIWCPPSTAFSPCCGCLQECVCVCGGGCLGTSCPCSVIWED